MSDTRLLPLGKEQCFYRKAGADDDKQIQYTGGHSREKKKVICPRRWPGGAGVEHDAHAKKARKAAYYQLKRAVKRANNE